MENYDKNCIFCKIANHEIKSNVIYEDDDVMAFLDISQVTYGHTLVICKKHYDNFLTCPKEIMNKMFNLAQRIGQVAIHDLHALGVNILTNCYEAAGQTVNHFHIHVIPRYKNKEGFEITMKENDQNLNLPAIAETLTNSLK
ncbi:MAG: HIT family protein [Bacilli bacterium]|nr:HIT family protein [Bacilli bacterium]